MKPLIALCLAVPAFVGALYASGTPHLPKNFAIRGHKISRTDLLRGKHLFGTKALVGTGGKTCASCHDKPTKLQTASLTKQYTKLPELINKCLTHGERCKGKKLKGDSKDMLALNAWLIYRYRVKPPAPKK